VARLEALFPRVAQAVWGGLSSGPQAAAGREP
jgi:hypothetical protein